MGYSRVSQTFLDLRRMIFFSSRIENHWETMGYSLFWNAGILISGCPLWLLSGSWEGPNRPFELLSVFHYGNWITSAGKPYNHDNHAIINILTLFSNEANCRGIDWVCASKILRPNSLQSCWMKKRNNFQFDGIIWWTSISKRIK